MPLSNLPKELLYRAMTTFGMEPEVNSERPPAISNTISNLLRTDPLTPDDLPYLRQFMGLENTLTPTTLRPSHLSVRDNKPWYIPVLNPLTPPQVGHGTQPPLRTKAGNVSNEQLQNLPIGGLIPLETYNGPGLGHYTGSIGKDEQGPYASVYDNWDFKSPVVGGLMEKLMGLVGKDYHIYGRYPIELTDKGPRVSTEPLK